MKRLPSGELQSVEINTGGFLGFGSKTFKVPADKVEQKGQQIVLLVNPEQITPNAQ